MNDDKQTKPSETRDSYIDFVSCETKVNNLLVQSLWHLVCFLSLVSLSV